MTMRSSKELIKRIAQINPQMKCFGMDAIIGVFDEPLISLPNIEHFGINFDYYGTKLPFNLASLKSVRMNSHAKTKPHDNIAQTI